MVILLYYAKIVYELANIPSVDSRRLTQHSVSWRGGSRVIAVRPQQSGLVDGPAPDFEVREASGGAGVLGGGRFSVLEQGGEIRCTSSLPRKSAGQPRGNRNPSFPSGRHDGVGTISEEEASSSTSTGSRFLRPGASSSTSTSPTWIEVEKEASSSTSIEEENSFSTSTSPAGIEV